MSIRKKSRLVYSFLSSKTVWRRMVCSSYLNYLLSVAVFCDLKKKIEEITTKKQTKLVNVKTQFSTLIFIFSVSRPVRYTLGIVYVRTFMNISQLLLSSESTYFYIIFTPLWLIYCVSEYDILSGSWENHLAYILA